MYRLARPGDVPLPAPGPVLICRHTVSLPCARPPGPQNLPAHYTEWPAESQGLSQENGSPLDVKKYFYSIDSIDRQVLKQLLVKRFKKLKKKRPELYEDLICFLGVKLYTRYMDDIIIAPSKETAREWLAKIRRFVKERLHLDLNSKT